MRSSRDVDARSDIWSLGCILYEAIGGQTAAHVAESDDRDHRACVLLRRANTPLAELRSERPARARRCGSQVLGEGPGAPLPQRRGARERALAVRERRYGVVARSDLARARGGRRCPVIVRPTSRARLAARLGGRRDGDERDRGELGIGRRGAPTPRARSRIVPIVIVAVVGRRRSARQAPTSRLRVKADHGDVTGRVRARAAPGDRDRATRSNAADRAAKHGRPAPRFPRPLRRRSRPRQRKPRRRGEPKSRNAKSPRRAGVSQPATRAARARDAHAAAHRSAARRRSTSQRPRRAETKKNPLQIDLK